MAATITIVRTLVDDQAGASQIFDDSHYQIIIDLETNEYRAAATAAKALAAHYASKVSVTVGPVRIENQQKASAYQGLARGYDQRAREGGGSGAGIGIGAGAPVVSGISIAEMDALREDTDRYNSVFTRGMTDNPPDDVLEEDCGC